MDIGSASVGSASVTFGGDAPLVEQVKRVPLGIGSAETRSALAPALDQALEKLLHDVRGSFSAVHIILASPWQSAKIRNMTAGVDEPRTITNASVAALLERYRAEVPPAEGQVDVEAAALQVKVNGYQTTIAHPVFGKDLKINLYESEMPASLHASITERLGRVHQGKVAFHTFPLVAVSALRTIADEHSFIVLDVGGEVSDIAVVHQDGIHFLASIPAGYWTLARAFGKNVGDAASRLTLFARGELSSPELRDAGEQFKKVCTPWVKDFEATLLSAAEFIPVPRTVYLVSDKDPLLWLKRALEECGTLGTVPAPITPATIQRFVELGSDGSFDVFLALDAIFIASSNMDVLGEQIPTVRRS